MPEFKHIKVPTEGQVISVDSDNRLQVPPNPLIPIIEGDGIGGDITKATLNVLNAAVETVYKGERKLVTFEIYAGEKAKDVTGEWLPQETFDAIRHFKVALKGPLTTPVGGGFRSLNVTLRQVLDLYACLRPVKYYKGVPSPVRHPERMNMVIFRENTEDVYSGIEYAQGTDEAARLISYLRNDLGVASVREDSGIGIKPISIFGTKRLVRRAIQYALDYNRSSVTLMHKGNIMKFTEGAFKNWGYELAKDEFPNETITEDEVWEKHDGKAPEGKIVIKDRIADSMFQQIITRTDEYDVVATTNLNGDYLSDAAAAQVGGIGIAPGANLGDGIGLFEATHGTAPKYTGKDVSNPSSLLLSAVLMLEYMNWTEASDAIQDAMEATFQQKRVTYDLARLMGPDVPKLKCSEFANAIIENLQK